MKWFRSLVSRVKGWRAARREKYIEHEYRTGRTQAGNPVKHTGGPVVTPKAPGPLKPGR